ncbi:MAG: hypothetical protein DI535_16055 [Citrobacter freundii]|nr:MAG: hypothetical protein DI535_16055 [Citrobacter freundii]
MKPVFIRTLCVLALAVFLLQDASAQRGRVYHPRRGGYYGGPGYSPYRGMRVSFSYFSGPRAIYPYRGINYSYYGGHYYRPYGSYFQLVAPPVGISIGILPRGYRTIYAGSIPYYYYGGTYYRPGKKVNTYDVVDAPIGASVPELPEDAKVVVINGQKYYELDGTYYKEDIRDNSEIWYTVVGKDGKLDTDQEAIDSTTDNGPQVGDVVDKLPADCRTVVVNGQKYYVSPDDIYYEEVIGQNTISYKIVGK